MNVWILITNKFNAYRVILLGKQVAHLKLFALPPSLLESRLSLYAEKFSSAFLGDLEKWRGGVVDLVVFRNYFILEECGYCFILNKMDLIPFWCPRSDFQVLVTKKSVLSALTGTLREPGNGPGKWAREMID